MMMMRWGWTSSSISSIYSQRLAQVSKQQRPRLLLSPESPHVHWTLEIM